MAGSAADAVGSLPQQGSQATSEDHVPAAALTGPAGLQGQAAAVQGLPWQAVAAGIAAPDSLDAHLAALQLSGQLQSSSRSGSEVCRVLVRLKP